MFQKITRRYSLALYTAAKEGKVLPEVEKDVKMIIESLEGSRELTLFFSNPVINSEKKIAIIKELFEGKISPLTLDYLYLLVEKKRENIVIDLLKDFVQLKNDNDGIVDTIIETTVEMDSKEKEKMNKKVEGYLNLKINPTYEINKDLIGGFRVKFKDTIIDASIKRQLEVLKKRFKEGEIVLN
ncbi:F0F1 ATP synthase subunit delta [soil metagenome]